MIAESPVSAQKPPLTSWNISQTPVPIKLHTAASSLSISSKQPTPLVANTPPLVSRSPLSFKNPTPSPKPISTPFGSSVSVALNFFVKPIMNYQMAPVDINSPQKSRSLVESRDSIAQTTPGITVD